MGSRYAPGSPPINNHVIAGQIGPVSVRVRAMAIQTKVILRFNGVKVDALGTNWNVVKSVPVVSHLGAGWSDRQLQRCRNHVHAVGRHDAHSSHGYRCARIQPGAAHAGGRRVRSDLRRGRSGQRWHHPYTTGAFAAEVTFAVNNEAGDIMMQIGRITATRRVPY